MKKIRNFGTVNYNKRDKRIEYTYFEKEGDNWIKKNGQQTISNRVYIPSDEAVYQEKHGEKAGLSKDIFGNEFLQPIDCDFTFNLEDAPASVRNAINRYSYDIKPTVKYLSKHFEFNEEKDEVPPLRIHYMDIETIVDDGGFLPAWNVGPDRAGHHRGGITLIASYDNIEDHTYIFGCGEYTDTANPLGPKVTYTVCHGEADLLSQYKQYLRNYKPDIITGWNVYDYDMPYIINRVKLHFGEKGMYNYTDGFCWVHNKRRKLIVSDINIVDYMVLYKKFELAPRRSYSLANIIDVENIEIDSKGKIKYEGRIKDFYENDWNGFVRYCVQDAKLVYELDNKKKLMDTFVLLCYMAGIPFNEAIGGDISWMRIHDASIYRYCKEEDHHLPEAKPSGLSEDFKFTGAFVMSPETKVYNYATVYDVASLYPSCIRALNISIDTWRGTVTSGDIKTQKGPFVVEFYDPMYLSLGKEQEKVHERLSRYKNVAPIDPNPPTMTFNNFDELRNYLYSMNYCVAANGAIFTKEFRGIIPTLLDHWIAIRKKNKSLMGKYKKKYQTTKDKKYKALAERYDTIQNVYKIRLNSLYGFIGSKWSRFFNVTLSEAVTQTGQYVIKSTIDSLKFKHPLLSAFYADTDSVFLHYGPILERKGIDLKDQDACIAECLKIDKGVEKLIEANCNHISNNIMLTENVYFFESEEIIDRMIITSKKKYIARLCYDKVTGEKVESELIKGMEFKKSNISPIVKKYLKKMTVSIMDGMTEDEVREDLKRKWLELPDMSIDDLAYVQGANGIAKHNKGCNVVINNESSAITYWADHCPFHIKGTIALNSLIEWDNDLHVMDRVQEGDKAKIVFVTANNLFEVKAITFVGDWHPKLYQYFSLDFEYIFNRIVLQPLRPTLDAVGYKIFFEDILGGKYLDTDNSIIQPSLF